MGKHTSTTRYYGHCWVPADTAGAQCPAEPHAMRAWRDVEEPEDWIAAAMGLHPPGTVTELTPEQAARYVRLEQDFPEWEADYLAQVRQFDNYDDARERLLSKLGIQCVVWGHIHPDRPDWMRCGLAIPASLLEEAPPRPMAYSAPPEIPEDWERTLDRVCRVLRLPVNDGSRGWWQVTFSHWH